MTHVVRCGIYASRPQFCRDYPGPMDFMPAACTYRFVNGERQGSCQSEVCQEQACCNFPRKGGEPVAEACPTADGGLPCKHIMWVELPTEKKASNAADYDPGELFDQVLNSMLFKGE